MSDYLFRLAARASGVATGLTPRRPSLFEPERRASEQVPVDGSGEPAADPAYAGLPMIWTSTGGQEEPQLDADSPGLSAPADGQWSQASPVALGVGVASSHGPDHGRTPRDDQLPSTSAAGEMLTDEAEATAPASLAISAGADPIRHPWPPLAATPTMPSPPGDDHAQDHAQGRAEGRSATAGQKTDNHSAIGEIRAARPARHASAAPAAPGHAPGHAVPAQPRTSLTPATARRQTDIGEYPAGRLGAAMGAGVGNAPEEGMRTFTPRPSAAVSGESGNVLAPPVPASPPPPGHRPGQHPPTARHPLTRQDARTGQVPRTDPDLPAGHEPFAIDGRFKSADTAELVPEPAVAGSGVTSHPPVLPRGDWVTDPAHITVRPGSQLRLPPSPAWRPAARPQRILRSCNAGRSAQEDNRNHNWPG